MRKVIGERTGRVTVGEDGDVGGSKGIGSAVVDRGG